MDSTSVRAVGSDVLLQVHVRPGAKRSRIVGEHGDRLKIDVASPPVDGKANRALCAFLAEVLGLGKSSISVVAGSSSRQKCIRISDVSVPEICDIVDALVAAQQS